MCLSSSSSTNTGKAKPVELLVYRCLAVTPAVDWQFIFESLSESFYRFIYIDDDVVDNTGEETCSSPREEACRWACRLLTRFVYRCIYKVYIYRRRLLVTKLRELLKDYLKIPLLLLEEGEIRFNPRRPSLGVAGARRALAVDVIRPSTGSGPVGPCRRALGQPKEQLADGLLGTVRVAGDRAWGSLSSQVYE